MKVLLTKDVYKLGRAGDIKKVADGYGRNYLLPQGLAVLATAGAIKQAEKIRSQAEILRANLNSELKDLASQIAGVTLTFAAKAGETGKLVGVAELHVVARVGEHLRDRRFVERAGVCHAGSTVFDHTNADACTLCRDEMFELAFVDAHGGFSPAPDVGLNLLSGLGLGDDAIGDRLQVGNFDSHAAVPPIVMLFTRSVG